MNTAGKTAESAVSGAANTAADRAVRTAAYAAGNTAAKTEARRAISRRNTGKLLLLLAFAALVCILYMVVGVRWGNEKLVAYAMKIRTPKLIVMVITAFAIGAASIVFQTVIGNTIVTPCLLGMNSLYTLIHTAVVFAAGAGSLLARNANVSFVVDLAIMGAVATIVYSYLFRKTKNNVLYVLLIGTVLTSFFSSIQTTMTRIMDPNEYESLLATLVASFSNINSEVIVISLVLLVILGLSLRRELALLDVLQLGKAQAINLGVDYDRCIRRLLLGVTLCIAVATAMVGPISFLGLIIANLARQLLQTYRHSQLVLGSALIGMAVLIGGQLLVEHVFSYMIPVSVFITVGGGVYFLYLLLTQKKA
ncbi:MAG: iron chelate uptake ABC transporter family permease subunit [Eubacteriales bacterium]|nr:iron chelate uptake ABC transporter family permease subunit [Eubacteriales bacterium]